MPIASFAIQMDGSSSAIFFHPDVLNPPAVVRLISESEHARLIIDNVIFVTTAHTRYLSKDEQKTFEQALRASGRVRQVIRVT
jgi:hypothetical protein